MVNGTMPVPVAGTEAAIRGGRIAGLVASGACLMTGYNYICTRYAAAKTSRVLSRLRLQKMRCIKIGRNFYFMLATHRALKYRIPRQRAVI